MLEVITEKVSLEEAIWTEPSTKMAFLPDGGEISSSALE